MTRWRYRTRITESAKCSHRLTVRSSDFHSGNTGSIPVGSTKCGISLMVELQPSKLNVGVQFSYSAPYSRVCELGTALCLRNKGLWVQIPPRLPYTRIAQSGEQHPYKVKVVGSIPTASTNGGLAHLGRALALQARGDGIVAHILHHILV